MEILSLGAKEIDRLEIIQLVTAKRLSVTKAAQQYGVSHTWMSQLVNAYRREGASALVSVRRGKQANNRISDTTRTVILSLIRETLRKWMVEDGIWTTRSGSINTSFENFYT